MPSADPRRDRRHWGSFLGVFLVVVAFYEIGNYAFAPSLEIAQTHARSLWQLQQQWGLDVEPAIQQAVDSVVLADVPWLMGLLVYFYVGPHFVLTFGLFAWTYWYRFDSFDQLRNVFASFTVIAFGFQWAYPLAPPRLLPEVGLRYTLDEWLPVTGDSPAILAATNPYAAFPSVHTGWALLVAYFGVTLSRSRWRHLWWLYPALIILSILATANHFLLDIVATAPFFALAVVFDRMIRRRAPPVAATPEPAWTGRQGPLADRLAAPTALPAQPRNVNNATNWMAGARLFIDYALTVPPAARRLSPKLRGYPPGFDKVRIRMRDDTQIVGWLGRAAQRAPLLVIVPGLFTSKDNAMVKKRALRVHRQWGWNVLTIDLRGNGESDPVPSSPGFKEAEDLVDVVTWARAAVDVDGVAMYAESLAASAAVLAAAEATRSGVLFAERGVLAVSGFADVATTIQLYDNPPRHNRQLREVVKFFTFLLRLSGQGARTFGQYVDQSSRFYRVPLDQVIERSSPARVVRAVADPVLVLHSRDDTLVPVQQVEALAEVARRTDNLAVWILPWGHHCLYEMADARWFWGVLDGFFRPAPTTHK